MKRISQIILFLIMIVFVIGMINSLFSSPWYCLCGPGEWQVEQDCENFCWEHAQDLCLYYTPLDYFGICKYIGICGYTYYFECSMGGHGFRSYETYCPMCR